MSKFSREEMDQMYAEAWEAVDPKFRESAVEFLRGAIPEESVSLIRTAIAKYGRHDWVHSPEFGHHGFGTMARNELRRAGYTDDKLPPFDAYYGEGTDCRNWDDYYVQAIVEAVDA